MHQHVHGAGEPCPTVVKQPVIAPEDIDDYEEYGIAHRGRYHDDEKPVEMRFGDKIGMKVDVDKKTRKHDGDDVPGRSAGCPWCHRVRDVRRQEVRVAVFKTGQGKRGTQPRSP